MDPQAAYQAMLLAVHDGDQMAAQESAENLLAWLDKGGFAPDVLLSVDQVGHEGIAVANNPVLVRLLCDEIRRWDYPQLSPADYQEDTDDVS